ncbi:hypothetical protein ASPVEDRAFT_820783 [Aspergillus versicolor CBS 583.65]|uniref:Rhodopsin domain-containing protein n=1 Tax=Aspergillus versicolor CBS 583.65 TaxID=1036611 RepID=A0A1L9PTN2_ASPVE|nr:uncharacterized protein ASPVEDRAFT_820783 [Aspergillus versicolor CBS 583.65]OJJ04887.1 hypothetical protein ASPVEDRAFT_820783 [Aspergillus versicolor CBS 583.65]
MDSSSDDLPHDNLQAQAIGLIFGFPAAATVVVLLRVYIRVWMRSFAADDWVICAALALYWAETVTSYFTIKLQYIGYHVWDIPEDYNAVLAGKYSYATELLYNPILALIKASILLFLLRLTGQKVAVRRTIWAIMVLNAVAAVATFLVTVFNCVPIASNWNPAAYPDKKCVNFADFVTGTASVAIFTDFLVLLLPTWIVYNLHIARKQKIMLVGILSFGLITVLAGIIRVILLDKFDRNIPPDSSYSVLFCISTIEVGLAFVAACAPALKPLFVRLVPRLFSSASHTGQYNRPAGRYGYAYDLDHVSKSRKTQGGNTTSVLGGDEDVPAPCGSQSVSKRKNGIMMTTETEVRWEDSPGTVDGTVNDSSTESLVQLGGR